MAWWQVILILMAAIAAGTAIGALLSYLISRFTKKRRTTLSSDLVAPPVEMPLIPDAGIMPVEAVGDELYQGRVELEIAAPIDFVQMVKLQAHLYEVPDLGLVSVGGSATGETAIVVVADKPLPLLSILKQMPLIKGVVKKENNIQVALEARQAA
ncbi:hypothetical protein ACFLYR_00390 [Chloroflexota bacterium]